MTTLHPAEQEYRREIDRLSADREAVMAKRDQAIRDELAKGKTMRAVGAEFGISYQRVAQIAVSSTVTA